MNFNKKLKDTLTIKLDKAFGLDISDRSVEIIELEKVFRFSVSIYGRADLPAGIVENGKIIDKNALATVLKDMLRSAKPKKVSTNKVVVSLPESQVYVECLVIDAKLKQSEVESLIEEKISLELPVGLSKMYWDFLLKSVPDKTKKVLIFVGVMKDVAKDYVSFCNSIGLEVVSLSVESLSLARAILKKSDKQSLIIDIGSRSSNLVFYDGGDRVNMSTNISLGGEDFTHAIVVGLNKEPEQAEALKKQWGFTPGSANPISSVISKPLVELAKEVTAGIKYYELTFKQSLDEIYLIGGGSLTPGIAPELKKLVGREVQLVNVGNHIDLSALGDKAKVFSLFANVIGLGMLGASGEFADINLLKSMPKAEVNLVNRLNLFKLGYLSRVNTIRTVFNNKYVLIIMIVLIALIFAILLQQAENYGFASVGTSSITEY
jgi:type IV pilus assembly protein PilM